MRARNIKPGFFLNAELSDVCFQTRLLFIGLWCYADREGRFEWKEKQIKATIFPYDNVNVHKLLCNLMSLHLITCHDGVGYVENFKKHQNPHPHEAKSILPEKPVINQCHDMSLLVTKCNADVMIPDIRIKDTIIQDTIASGDKSPPPSALFDLWNRMIESPKASVFNKSREAKSRLRLKERSLEEWSHIIDRISRTPFLKGDNDKGWRADFDWIIANDVNSAKIIEGKYDTKSTKRGLTNADKQDFLSRNRIP